LYGPGRTGITSRVLLGHAHDLCTKRKKEFTQNHEQAGMHTWQWHHSCQPEVADNRGTGTIFRLLIVRLGSWTNCQCAWPCWQSHWQSETAET
jgi:hypothetical protein